jgi:hypothetical protein
VIGRFGELAAHAGGRRIEQIFALEADRMKECATT